MRVAGDGEWDAFMAMTNRALPKRSDTMQIMNLKEAPAKVIAPAEPLPPLLEYLDSVTSEASALE